MSERRQSARGKGELDMECSKQAYDRRATGETRAGIGSALKIQVSSGAGWMNNFRTRPGRDGLTEVLLLLLLLLLLH